MDLKYLNWTWNTESICHHWNLSNYFRGQASFVLEQLEGITVLWVVFFFKSQSNILSTVPSRTPWAPVSETPQTSRQLCRDALDVPWCMEVSQRTEEPQQIGLTASGCYTSQPRWEDTCTQQCVLTHKHKFLLLDTFTGLHSNADLALTFSFTFSKIHIHVCNCIDEYFEIFSHQRLQARWFAVGRDDSDYWPLEI